MTPGLHILEMPTNIFNFYFSESEKKKNLICEYIDNIIQKCNEPEKWNLFNDFYTKSLDMHQFFEQIRQLEGQSVE